MCEPIVCNVSCMRTPTINFQSLVHKDVLLLWAGIANTLDLTCRCLPRLHSFSLQPQVLQFPAYSKSEVAKILNHRLGVAGGSVIEPMAVMYLAGKVAALKGDIRNALDLCR